MSKQAGYLAHYFAFYSESNSDSFTDTDSLTMHPYTFTSIKEVVRDCYSVARVSKVYVKVKEDKLGSPMKDLGWYSPDGTFLGKFNRPPKQFVLSEVEIRYIVHRAITECGASRGVTYVLMAADKLQTDRSSLDNVWNGLPDGNEAFEEAAKKFYEVG